MAVLGELGRFPLYNDICENIIQFYLHAKQNSSDSLLGQTLDVSKQLHNDGYKSWFTGVTTILNETELDEETMTLVRYNLRSLYKNIWSTKLNEEAIRNRVNFEHLHYLNQISRKNYT